MILKPGDRIRYNAHHFQPKTELGICIDYVEQVAEVDTGYGIYEEYKVSTGQWISELQLLPDEA